MTARVTDSEVRAIVETNLLDKIETASFIETANALTDWVVEQDVLGVLSINLQKRIELHLAAHFYSHRDQQYSSRSTQGASGSFQGQTGMVLSSTQYGQTAMLLDVTGALAQRNREVIDGGQHTVGLIWLGDTTETSHTDSL